MPGRYSCSASSIDRAWSDKPPFFLPIEALYELSRRLIGDEIADGLELPRSRVWRHLWSGGRALSAINARLARATRPTAEMSVRVGEQLTRGIVAFGLPGGTRFR